MAAMIIEAPSLLALAELLEQVPWEHHDPLRAVCKEHVSNYVAALDLSRPLRDQTQALKSLLRVLRKVESLLSLQELICMILNPDRYVRVIFRVLLLVRYLLSILISCFNDFSTKFNSYFLLKS